MDPVEFRDMEYVMAVHEKQSFSGAARKHFISQPVLSRVVRKVERNLGVTLFDRSSIPLKLSLIHISEPTRRVPSSRMPSSA